MGPVPELIAYTLPNDNGVIAWCPHCRRYHTHGFVNVGHNAAHCANPKSPFKATGYQIVVMGPVPDVVLKDYRSGKPKGLGRITVVRES